jgi:hypothetical protein
VDQFKDWNWLIGPNATKVLFHMNLADLNQASLGHFHEQHPSNA